MYIYFCVYIHIYAYIYIYTYTSTTWDIINLYIIHVSMNILYIHNVCVYVVCKHRKADRFQIHIYAKIGCYMDAASGGSGHDGKDGNLDNWDLGPFWNTALSPLNTGEPHGATFNLNLFHFYYILEFRSMLYFMDGRVFNGKLKTCADFNGNFSLVNSTYSTGSTDWRWGPWQPIASRVGNIHENPPGVDHFDGKSSQFSQSC